MSEPGDRAAVAALAALGFVLTIVATRHGPGASPDSVSYLAAARTISRHGTVLDVDGSPLVLWPPGFPAVLGAFERVGFSGATAARLANGAMLATTVVLSFILLRRHVRSRWTVIFGVAAVAVSPTLLSTTGMVWSEPTFDVLVLASVLLLEDACRTRRPAQTALAGLAVSCATLVRFLGFALVVPGVFVIVLAHAAGTHDRARSLGRGLLAASWFSVAALGPGLWALRNVLVGDVAVRQRNGGAADRKSVV